MYEKLALTILNITNKKWTFKYKSLSLIFLPLYSISCFQIIMDFEALYPDFEQKMNSTFTDLMTFISSKNSNNKEKTGGEFSPNRILF